MTRETSVVMGSMPRSEINDAIALAEDFFLAHKYALPIWSAWSLDDWLAAGREMEHVRKAKLGWIVRDFGSERFAREGSVGFTLHNMGTDDPPGMIGVFLRALLVHVHQVTPLHAHPLRNWTIENRGGGRLIVELYHAGPDDELDETRHVVVRIDGIGRTIAPGDPIAIAPGNTIEIPPRVYRKYWAEEASAMAVEFGAAGRGDPPVEYFEPFASLFEIDEDEPAKRLLCHEYPEMLID
jgi:D-lyxose ketol-isomerase